MLKNLMIIGSGGFLGSVARYLVSQLNLTVSFHSIPVGTLIVNITGSLVIGFLLLAAGRLVSRAQTLDQRVEALDQAIKLLEGQVTELKSRTAALPPGDREVASSTSGPTGRSPMRRLL